MEGLSTVRVKIKGQIKKFSGMLTKGCKKPDQRFMAQVIYGIQASKDVKLSNYSQELKGRGCFEEDGGPVILQYKQRGYMGKDNWPDKLFGGQEGL